MTHPNNPTTQDEFFMGAGFHKHKQGYKGKGLYFSVGGYDITKGDAKAIFDAVNSEVNKILDELEEVGHGSHNGKEFVVEIPRSAIHKARRS